MANGRGEMRSRIVILPVDDVLRMFGDYLGTDTVPVDSVPVRMRGGSNGNLHLVVESNYVPAGGSSVMVDFQLKRVYGISDSDTHQSIGTLPSLIVAPDGRSSARGREDSTLAEKLEAFVPEAHGGEVAPGLMTTDHPPSALGRSLIDVPVGGFPGGGKTVSLADLQRGGGELAE